MDWARRKLINNPFKVPDDDSDVKLVVEGVTLNLHSLQLTVSSPKLAKMINDNANGISPKDQINITNAKAIHFIEFLKFFYPEFCQDVTDNTPFENILELCEAYETIWLKNRISAYFLEKSEQQLRDFGLSVVYYADAFNLETLKLVLLKEYSITIQFIGQELKKKYYTSLGNTTKFKLARLRLKNLLSELSLNKKIFVEVEKIFEGIEEENQPKAKPIHTVPFENVFKKKQPSCDIVIKVKEDEFYLHQGILKRLSPKFKRLLESNKQGEMNELVLDSINNVNAFLLMIRFFYPQYKFEVTEKHPVAEIYNMCNTFEVEWMKTYIEKRIIAATDFKSISSLLKTLQIAESLNYSESKEKILESLKKAEFISVTANEEYCYLEYSTRYLLAKWRLLSIKTCLNSPLYPELLLIFKEVDKIVLKEPDYIGDNFLHNAHSSEGHPSFD